MGCYWMEMECCRILKGHENEGVTGMSSHPFFEIHKELPREGPGNDESTKKAFGMLSRLPEHPQILDVGCGPGMQTKALASLTDGTITAVDRHEPFLRELEKWVADHGAEGKIQTVCADMFALPFAEGSFDLIWSEGAIYIIGFERGMREWGKLLRPGGYLVASEVTWLTGERPAEIEAFWQEHYPAIAGVEENKQIVQRAGYRLVGSFTLPESGWWEYYGPLEKRVAKLRDEYAGQVDMQQALDETQQEIDLYRKYGTYYGYTFFIMQRPES